MDYRKSIKRKMDYRKLISENFKVDEEMLELMTQYAEFHAKMEVKCAQCSDDVKCETTLPYALKVLERLNLHGKKVVISHMEPTVEFYTKIDFDLQEMPNLEDHMVMMAINMVAEALNEKLEESIGIRIGRLITSMAIITEVGQQPRLVAYSQHKIIYT